jgi:hypothetical protein
MGNSKLINRRTQIPQPKDLIALQSLKNAAQHLKAASTNLKAAGKYYEQGNHEQAAYRTIVAQGHLNLVNKTQDKDIKNHVLNS